MLKNIKNKTKSFLVQEEGQGMAEYGLIILGVVIAVIVVVKLLGTKLLGVFTNITNAL